MTMAVKMSPSIWGIWEVRNAKGKRFSTNPLFALEEKYKKIIEITPKIKRKTTKISVKTPFWPRNSTGWEKYHKRVHKVHRFVHLRGRCGQFSWDIFDRRTSL